MVYWRFMDVYKRDVTSMAKAEMILDGVTVLNLNEVRCCVYGLYEEVLLIDVYDTPYRGRWWVKLHIFEMSNTYLSCSRWDERIKVFLILNTLPF